MQKDADPVVAEILHADENFLIEIGRLTLLFSRIEDCLVHDALALLEICDEKMKEPAASTTMMRLRILEKRDFLKRVVAEIGRFHGVDHSRVGKVLDELSNINRLRRSIVHGWIRWSVVDESPILVDSQGQSVPAWPSDVMDLNLRVLDWIKRYYSEQHAFMRGVLSAYDALSDRLTRYPKATPELQALFRNLKTGDAELWLSLRSQCVIA